MTEFDTALLAELDNDPEALGYAAAGWSANPPTLVQYEAVVVLLNTADRPKDEPASQQDFAEVIGPASWSGLTDARDRDYLLFIGGMEPVPLDKPSVRQILTNDPNGIFPTGPTKAAILALAQGLQSRAQELGLRRVKVGDLRRLKGDTS